MLILRCIGRNIKILSVVILMFISGNIKGYQRLYKCLSGVILNLSVAILKFICGNIKVSIANINVYLW